MARDHRTDRPARPDPRADPGQPRGRTGDEARTARSPLRLRLVLALFGLVVCTVLAVAWFAVDEPPGDSRAPGWVLAVLAALAAVDLVVVSRRLRRRR
ncbi:DUF6343 family protein [Kineococcus aurantiacus]|uniref:Uncharacterized protein n=1 Tax=Kineococcus aurantiacus TaxID=37633 RepID=A0A7Y9DPE8_9ACTN|nr:DUF6343 family protein [Kineococcus aurantiacus]NYD24357.1 hypothetical protein [Kineococcus aurantiacus]